MTSAVAPLDAVVVGSGPNGLSAAITLARAGLKVRVLEAHSQPGGGLSSRRWQGFVFDTGSAVHPLAYASPVLRQWPLHAFGLDWVHPPAPFVHLWPDGAALTVPHDLGEAARALGADGPAWRALFGPLVHRHAALLEDVLRPLPRLPRSPLLLARFGAGALLPAPVLAAAFKTGGARAVWAGLAAHANVSPATPGASAAALLLGSAAHAGGWPIPRGGAQSLTDALVAYFEYLGGELQTGCRVSSRNDLPPARAVLVDSDPWTARRLCRTGDAAYDWWLRQFRYGAGVLKVDYALSGPVPWLDPGTAQRSATVHLGGSLEDIVQAETAVARGRLPAQPFILAAQPSLFDPTRAPQGGHTLWAYMHAPAHAGPQDFHRLEAALERAAPGFRRRVLRREVMTARQLQSFSPVYGGGDVNGGRFDLRGLLARPVPTPTPYRTPDPQVYLCSSATPPGGGVHGMCGYHAAQAVLRDLFR